jgi:hypothetical protein
VELRERAYRVSPYVQDRHSQAADELLSSGGRVLLTPLHLAEWAELLTCGTICATFSHAVS